MLQAESAVRKTISVITDVFNRWTGNGIFGDIGNVKGLAAKRRAMACMACILLVAISRAAAAEDPQWIWTDGPRDGEQRVALQKTFDISGSQNGELWLANAYCDCEVFLNGESLRSIRAYQQPSRLVLGPLSSGENQLSFICSGVDGPSAVGARLTIGQNSIASDATWHATELRQLPDGRQELDDQSWGPAETYGVVDMQSWATVGVATNVADDYTQWKQALQQSGSTLAEQLQVQPGFQVERLYSAGAGEGSWISLAQDQRGRWVIGHEEQGLVRIGLKEQGTLSGTVATLEKLALPISECRGLVFAHDSLYAMANKSLSLFRLRDTNDNDQFDQVEQLKSFSGGTGHGRNQLTLGPDGMIYAIFGDSVQQPVDARYLAPLIPLPDEVQKTQNGFVARTDAQGQSWQIVARGLRNPYGLDFNRQGDLFTYDADAEYDMGSSWYRPTRVLHLLPGGDYGWRSVTKRWPPYNPDSATMPQPTLDIGRGSPTAVEFAAGENFPPAYRNDLFALDWSYGRILAVHFHPCGSSYRGAAEVFLRGTPLNVTDLEFGQDGAMYFVTGGRQTQSGLYRVRYIGDAVSEPEQTLQQSAADQHATAARELRRQLESLRGDISSATLETAWQHLDARDPWIRHAARTVIESLPVDMWRERIFVERQIDRWLSAAIALQRFGDDRDRSKLGQELAAVEALRLLPWQQREWADLCLRQVSDSHATDPKWDALFDQLWTVFPAHDFPLDQLTSQLLAQRDSGRLVPQVMPLLDQSRLIANQRQQMHWLYVLSTQSKGWTAELRSRFFAALSDMDTFEAGEGMPTFRRLIREAAVAHLPAEEREQWSRWMQGSALEQLPELPPARTNVVKQWMLNDFPNLSKDQLRDADLQRGAQMFATARCVVCHRVGTMGGLSGPDLTGVASRFSAQDLLASILTPSAVISEKYVNEMFELTDGRVLSGRAQVTDYRSPDVVLIPNLLEPDRIVTFSKQQIAARRESPVSPMPGGLVDGLSHGEILDLLAYLLNQSK